MNRDIPPSYEYVRGNHGMKKQNALPLLFLDSLRISKALSEFQEIEFLRLTHDFPLTSCTYSPLP